MPILPPPSDDPAFRRLELLAGAQTGEPAAVGAFLAALAPLLKPVTWRLAGALWHEDALQEALIMIHQRLAEFSPGRDPLPLAKTIAARRALDLRRMESRRGGGRNADPSIFETLAAPETAAVEASMMEPAGGLLGLLRQLPEADRQILILTELEEFSASQAAAILGISAVAARVRALRARGRLKKLWTQVRRTRHA